jgi:hypothetical protein
MTPMADINARDTKLIQYLNEAYGKEKELETALQAHIAMTTKAPYKKRLQEHLRETKAHAREVQRRIKQLGGKAEAGPISSGPDVIADAATGLTSVASKAVAAAQGPLHAIRGTGEAEKMLKNARTEFHNEFEEIGFYASIKREEERMAKFLEKQIEQLAKAVAREEIPAAERNGGSSRRRSSSRRSSSSSSSSNGSSSGTRSTRAKSSSSRAKSGSTRAKASTSRAKSGSSRAKASTSRAKSGSTRAKSGGGSRSKTASRSR